MASEQMAENVDLQALAAATKGQLSGIWDVIGIVEAERSTLLAKLVADVAGIYTHTVTAQDERRLALEGEIAALTETITNMQYAMEEQAAGVPPQSGRTLLAYRELLESKRSELQKTWDARERRMRELEAAMFKLYDEVVEPVPEELQEIGDKMSTARIREYEAGIAHVQAVKEDRAATIARLCEEIVELWADMSFTPADDFEVCIPAQGEGLGWGSSIIRTLEDKLAELKLERTERENRIDAMGKELTSLWKRLQTPEEEQTEFLEAHMGLGDDVLTAVEAYLAKKRVEFSAKLVDLVNAARVTIDGLWNEMRAGPQQRQLMFPLFFVEKAAFTEELYEQHEVYIQQLGKVLDDLKPLLKGIEKRDELKADKAEYESIISDPSRLLARGSSAARLKEEKLERRVKKELPAVTKRLRQQIVEWEAAAGRAFLVYDEPFLAVLDGEEAAETRAREDARAAREAKKADTSSLAASAGPSVIAENMKSASGAAPMRSTSVGRASLYKGAPAGAAPAAAGTRRTGGVGATRKVSTISGEAVTAAVDATAPATAPLAPATAKENTSGPARAGSSKTGADASTKSLPAVAAPPLPTVPTEPAAPIATVAAVTVSAAAKESAARMLQML